MKYVSAYPTLRVTDVIGCGALAEVSKLTLWNMFNIDE